MTSISPSRLSRVFYDSDGIRSFWRCLIFCSVLGSAAFAAVLASRAFHMKQGGEVGPFMLALGEALSFAIVLGATALMAWIEGRNTWSYGLGGRHRPRRFLYGCVGGFASLSVLVAVLVQSRVLVFDGQALHGWRIAAYGVAWAVAFTLVALNEEVLFRGYLQANITARRGFWWASCITSAIFAVTHIHNGGETVYGVGFVFAIGLMFCLMLRASGSLWLGIGFHAAWDWAQSYLYGTSDSGLAMLGHLFTSHAAGNPVLSGGPAGPEGSLLALPVIAVTMPLVIGGWLLIARRTPGGVEAFGALVQENPATARGT